jgi:hypothetical protein
MVLAIDQQAAHAHVAHVGERDSLRAVHRIRDHGGFGRCSTERPTLTVNRKPKPLESRMETGSKKGMAALGSAICRNGSDFTRVFGGNGKLALPVYHFCAPHMSTPGRFALDSGSCGDTRAAVLDPRPQSNLGAVPELTGTAAIPLTNEFCCSFRCTS